MPLRDFLNALKSLYFVDRQGWMTDGVWAAFQVDPPRFFIRADEATQQRIWPLIEPKENDVG